MGGRGGGRGAKGGPGEELGGASKECRVSTVIRPYLEAI